jgi:hypothetical protein
MGRAKPNPKAKAKAASPAVLPPAATRKRSSVPEGHEPDKRKSIKGYFDEEEHGPDILEGALEEEDKPDGVVDEDVVKEDDGDAKAIKEAEGFSHDGQY